MKKSLLLGITWVTLIALTATTLYAQTVTGTSLVDKMKAAVHTFTLSADLNAGQTGFESAPIAGKKTGNMLTAGEWNRVLEIVSQGGSGGTSNITWANFDGSGGVAMKWSNGITSIVRESAGNYRVTFSIPRPNTDYGIICTSGPSPSYLCFPNDKSTTSFLIKTSNPTNNVDAPFVSLIVTPFDVGTGVSSTGDGDKFTFLDADILLHNSGVTKIDKTTPVALDLSTVSGVTLPSGIKAVQLHVICNNYTAQNEAVSLNIWRSLTAMLRVCQQNVTGAANDVDTNTVYIPIADDKKTLYYSYQVPSTDTGGQIVINLRGFITE